MALEKHKYRYKGQLKESSNWYFRFQIDDEIYYGSTGTSNKKKAEAAERIEYDKVFNEVRLGAKPTLTTKLALERFLKTQERSGEYRNIKTYVRKMLGSKDSSKHDDVVVEVYGFDHDKDFHKVQDSDVQ